MPQLSDIDTVLIQDPRAGRAYLLSLSDISRYEMSPDNLTSIDEGVVIFSIPTDILVETTPPFNATGAERPAILIQHEAAGKSYLLQYDALQSYAIDQPTDPGGYDVSFIIPRGNELLDKLQPLPLALLQSGEASRVF